MGECGCTHIQWDHKIIDCEGNAWLFGVYPSCDYCDAPAGVDVWRVKPEDFYQWDVDAIPEFEVDNDYGTGFIYVIDPLAVRQAMEKAIIGFSPDSGTIDKIDAEVLSEEAFRSLRDVVGKERKHRTLPPEND